MCQSAKDYLVSAGTKVFNYNDTGALNDLNMAIEIDSNYILARRWRGDIKYKLKDFAGAIFDYSKVIFINPIDAETLNDRGNIKQEVNNRDGASNLIFHKSRSFILSYCKYSSYNKIYG